MAGAGGTESRAVGRGAAAQGVGPAQHGDLPLAVSTARRGHGAGVGAAARPARSGRLRQVCCRITHCLLLLPGHSPAGNAAPADVCSQEHTESRACTAIAARLCRFRQA